MDTRNNNYYHILNILTETSVIAFNRILALIGLLVMLSSGLFMSIAYIFIYLANYIRHIRINFKYMNVQDGAEDYISYYTDTIQLYIEQSNIISLLQKYNDDMKHGNVYDDDDNDEDDHDDGHDGDDEGDTDNDDDDDDDNDDDNDNVEDNVEDNDDEGVDDNKTFFYFHFNPYDEDNDEEGLDDDEGEGEEGLDDDEGEGEEGLDDDEGVDDNKTAFQPFCKAKIPILDIETVVLEDEDEEIVSITKSISDNSVQEGETPNIIDNEIVFEDPTFTPLTDKNNDSENTPPVRLEPFGC
jgi:hypothetical protein